MQRKSAPLGVTITVLVIALALAGAMGLPALAQDESPASPTPGKPDPAPPPSEPNQVPPITVTGIDPAQVTTGQAAEITVQGSNFTAATTVQLDGYGPLPTTVVNASTLRAAIPASLPVGQYTVRVSDPQGGNANAPAPLAVVAQATDVPTDTPTPSLAVSSIEPARVTAGQQAVLSVFGSDFAETTVVRLVGVGLMQTTFVSSGALMASLPASLAPGQYAVEVTDPVRGTAGASQRLNVVAPTATPPPPTDAPPPTQAPPPTDIPPTPLPPTPYPGEPSLVVRNFSASPASIAPGGTVALTFEIVNQGTRTALGGAVALDEGGQFVPAGGQASAVLADLVLGARHTVTLRAVASMDAPEGPVSIPITMTYHDFEANSYTSKATLSATVVKAEEVSQVTLAGYAFAPDPVEPGSRVRLTGIVTNSGNQTATNVLLRVTGAESVLLAGPQGDSLPLGDIAPGTSAAVDIDLVVRSGAEPGPQAQPVTITYLQDGEPQEVATSVTVDVAKVEETAPLMLLKSYTTGQDELQPGDRFTLRVWLENVGDGKASDMLVTFGTVESSGAPGGDTPGGDSGGGQQTSTTPSTTFAPLGAGGSIYVGDVEANGGKASLKQAFIVDGSVKSGIYNLPITLRYTRADGSTAQETLGASMVVVAPPRLQITLQGMVPEMVNVGEPFPLALEIANNGAAAVTLTGATTAGENVEVLEGADAPLSPVKAGEDTTFNALVMPVEEGPVSVTVTLRYMDDLNQEREIVRTYETEAMAPPPPPDDMMPGPPVTPEPQETGGGDDLVGRFLRGLLGLGS